MYVSCSHEKHEHSCMFPGNMVGMFPGNMVGMFPGNMVSMFPGNMVVWISPAAIADFQVELLYMVE